MKEQYIIVGGGGKGAGAVEALEILRCKTVIFKYGWYAVQHNYVKKVYID